MGACSPGEPTRPNAPAANAAIPTAGRPTVAGPSSWFEGVHARIAAGEYRVAERKGALDASNRRQRLRATWRGNGLSIVPLAVAAGGAPLTVRSLSIGRGSATRSLAGGGFRVGACRADGATDEKGACLRRVEREAGGIVEWWENRPGGLEQGFTVAQPPRAAAADSARDWLRIEVQVAGARTEIAADGSRAVLVGRDGRRLLYTGLVARDADGKGLPARMRAAGGGIWLEIDDAGARYPVEVDPILTAIEWSVESNQAGAGAEMFVSGAGDVNDDDLDDVLVAFPGYNGGEGRVFLYLGDGAGPDETPAWSSQGANAAGTPAATAGSHFGSSATTAGDVNGDDIADVVIGQSGWSNPEPSEGRAYVFFGAAGGLPAAPDSVVESNVANSLMGAASAAGDIDGDRFDDVIVGAPSTAGPGRILVFRGSAGGLVTAPVIVQDVDGTRFGAAVASGGDIDGDGRDDVVVAAPNHSAGGANSGAVFAYLGRDGGALVPAFPGNSASVGTNEAGAGITSVALLGDIDGDGHADVAAGSPNKNNGGAGSDADEGVVFVFRGSAAGLSNVPTLIESNVAGAGFGFTVAGPGDVNGDGHADIAVGAPGLDNGALANAGAVFLIPGSASGPATTNALLADNVLRGTHAEDNLGGALGAAGDVNGDGYADVIAGSPGWDNGENGEGRAHLFQGSANTNGLRRAADLAVESNSAGARLGLVVAGAGDVNGDGFADLALAAPDFDGANNGRVFLYHGGAAGPDTTADGTLVGPAGAGFGKAVARAGDINGDGFGDLVIGAPNFSDGQTDEGRLFVYLGSAAGITAATLPATFDSNVAGALLGTGVGASDTNGDGLHDVLAGAPGLASGQPAEGRVYLLRGSPAGLVTASPVTVESDIANARFGASVAGAGDVNRDGRGDVVVGAPGYSGDSPGEGRIYVYFGQAAGLSAPVIREGNEDNAALGTSVDTAGDVDSDGSSDVAAGAPGSNGNTGTVFVYEGVGGSIVDVPYSYAANVDGARLGASVAGGVDLDQDGNADVVVGAPGYSNGESNEGAVYVFLSGGTPLPGAVSQIIEGGAAGLGLGTSVAAAGDVNGDGVTDVLVGAPAYGNGQAGEGRALLHFGNTNGRPYRLRATRPNAATVVQTGNVVPASQSAFDLSMLASGPLGITNVKLETEVRPLGTPFNDNATVIEPAFTSTGLAGVTLTRRVTGLAGSTAYHFRARLAFDHTQRILRGRRTPWIYGSQAELLGVHLRTDGVAGGTACTSSAQCGAGFCVDGVCCTSECGGGVTTDCVACSAAAGGTSTDGICSPRAVGAGCNDSSLCTTGDSCQAGGLCGGAPTVVCTASDQCHDVGVCDPGLGTCPNPAKMDGTACSDSNMCTTTDQCQAGACTAGPARDCNDNNPCTTDSCDPASGCANVAIAGCTPPDGGPDAAAPIDAPSPDASVTDGEPPPPPDAADTPTASDGPLAPDAPPTAADAPRDTPSGRDTSTDATEIKRGGGGGGCDCQVGHPARQAIHAPILFAVATLLIRRRRRKPSP